MTKKGDRLWEVWYRDESHRQHHKSGFPTKKAAKLFLSSNEIAIENGDYIDPRAGKVPIGMLGEEWIKGHAAVWKRSYLTSIETSWRVHVKPKWGERTLNSIRHSEVQTWVSELASEKSATVVYRAFGILKGIFEMAIQDRRISKSPTERVALPKKGPSRRVYLTAKQLNALAEASGRYKPLVLTLGLCGLRWGEATGLLVEDLDFSRNRISVNKSATRIGKEIVVGSTKTCSVREVPMPRAVAEALLKQVKGKRPDDLVFTNDMGGYLRQQSSAKGNRGWFAAAIKRSGVPWLRVHDLRHTAASIAISSGANPKYVQRMLGHASAKMTLDTYSDLFDTDIDRVADSIDALMGGTR